MLFGGSGADWVGPGSGADAAMMRRKAEAVDAALALHGSHREDPLEVLRRVGGREFAAIAGAIIAARMEKVPVILDGFAATAAAAVLHARQSRHALDHCLLAQRPTEPGHRAGGRTGSGSSRCSISARRMAKGSARRSPPASSRRLRCINSGMARGACRIALAQRALWRRAALLRSAAPAAPP